MKGPPLGPGGEDITWPDQVAPRAERCLVPAKSNLKPQTSTNVCKARLDASEKKYTYLQTQMRQVESSYSPPARVIPELQSAISNSIKGQGELDGRVQKRESGVPSHHTGNIDGFISKVDKMNSRCEDLDNRVNRIHDVIDGLDTSLNASMVALNTNLATSVRDNTGIATRAYENTIGDLCLQTETKYEVLSSQFATLEASDNARRVDAIERKLEDVEKKYLCMLVVCTRLLQVHHHQIGHRTHHRIHLMSLCLQPN